MHALKSELPRPAGIPIRAGKTKANPRGFTLIELLVVIGIIAVLAAMLLPVLSKAKVRAQGSFCMNNTKQLALGWLMYPSDNGDKLMDNGAGGTPWVIKTPYLDFQSSSSNTNTGALLDSSQSTMASYVKSAATYKCPGDILESDIGPRVRSYAMNGMLGNHPNFPPTDPNDDALPGKEFKFNGDVTKESQLRYPGAANVIVFLDEQSDSIDDGTFMFEPGDPVGKEAWRNLPASYHNRCGSFSFADGHSEIHRWIDPRTYQASWGPFKNPPWGTPTSNGPWNGTSLNRSKDYDWMDDRMPFQLKN
jgi:prepilin-type N-terminal cleavage/methylation domain-containing protein